MGRYRVRFLYTPQWEGPIERWACRFLRKNSWRAPREYDFSDLYQEAYLTFLVCREKYPGVVEAPHFMSLFQTSLRNRFNDLSRRVMRRVPEETPRLLCPLGGDEYFTDYFDWCGGERDNTGYCLSLMAKAPTEVQQALQALEKDLERTESLKRNQRVGPRKRTNARLCELAGWDPNQVDLRKMVKNYMWGP